MCVFKIVSFWNCVKVNTDCKNILTNQSSELKLKFTKKNVDYRKQLVGDMIIGIKLFVVKKMVTTLLMPFRI